jgi:hypothetical protein
LWLPFVKAARLLRHDVGVEARPEPVREQGPVTAS